MATTARSLVVEGAPFLKWAGGKGRLLPELLRRLPRSFRRYHEPFVGAGALFFALAERDPGLRSSLSDLNADLILAYRVVRDSTRELVRELEALRAAHSRDAYYRAREEFNRRARGGVRRAALLIYLNKTGFNGLYRVNSKGELNVPFGRYVDPPIFRPETLARDRQLLASAEIAARDFEAAAAGARRGDLVYFDPPYDPISATAKFTSYASGGFGEGEQERLAATFDRLAARGVHVVLSNHDTPLVRRLYAGRGVHVDRVHVPRPINSRADARATAVCEVIVRSFA